MSNDDRAKRLQVAQPSSFELSDEDLLMVTGGGVLQGVPAAIGGAIALLGGIEPGHVFALTGGTVAYGNGATQVLEPSGQTTASSSRALDDGAGGASGSEYGSWGAEGD